MFTILACWPLAASASFLLAGEGRFATLEQQVAYRLDTATPDIGAVLAMRDGWLSQGAMPFHRRGGAQTVWARFDAPDHGNGLLLTTSPWDEAEFYAVRGGRVVAHQRSGSDLPWDARTTRVTMTSPIMHAGLVALDLVPGVTTTIYVRLHTEGRLPDFDGLRIYAWDPFTVQQAERHDRLLQGVFVGMMFFLVVYNLGLLLTTHEASYLYYVIMEVGFTTTWAVLFGLTFEFLWPAHPSWDYHGFMNATSLGGFGLAMFLRHYLDMPRHFPRLDPWFKWGGPIGLLGIPISYLPVSFHVMSLITLFMAPPMVLLILAVVTYAWRTRHPLAPNLLLAMACFAGGILVYFLGELGVLPMVDVTIHAAQIGSALAGFILSIGLGMRFQRVRSELAEQQLAHERERRAFMESQNRTLEAKVIERTSQLTAAQQQSDALLSNILPQAIIEELRAHGATEPRRHEEASILFTDFSGFTQAVSTMPPRRLVQELNDIFRAFDDIISEQGLEKIKTIGDAYMAAGGLPVSSQDHAMRCVRAGLALTAYIAQRNETAAMKWGLRVGVHSGSVVAGVVGKNKYAYDVWGDTVNIASRLESSGEINKVNISAYTFDLVREHFECSYRGKLEAKGKGQIDMYFVLRERAVQAVL
ncbi:MAG: adenylate/guanylate cyclase domain-containing protein [Pseudomonadota bacterium]